MNRRWILIGLGMLPLAILLVGLSGCNTPAPAPAAGPLRVGTLSDITGTVELRTGEAGTFAIAARGDTWDVGAEIRTNEDGSARLDLADGISLRIGPNSTLTNRSVPAQWQVALLQGVLWATFYERPLTVVTGLGRVSAIGMAATFKYSPNQPGTVSDDVWTIQCLRAACQFQDSTRSISLEDLGQLTIADGGAIVAQSLASRAEVDEFIANNPAAAGLLVNQQADAPAPSNTPLAADPPQATPATNAITATTADSGTAADQASRPASEGSTGTPTATPTATPTVTLTQTATKTATATARPTSKVVPTLPLPTNTPLPLATDTPQSSGGGGGGGGGGNPPPPPPAPTNPPPPPAPTDPPPRTAPPPKPA